jgi:hypothetical protein
MPKAENSSVLVHYLRPPRAGADFRRPSPPKCRRRPKHAAAARPYKLPPLKLLLTHFQEWRQGLGLSNALLQGDPKASVATGYFSRSRRSRHGTELSLLDHILVTPELCRGAGILVLPAGATGRTDRLGDHDAIVADLDLGFQPTPSQAKRPRIRWAHTFSPQDWHELNTDSAVSDDLDVLLIELERAGTDVDPAMLDQIFERALLCRCPHRIAVQALPRNCSLRRLRTRSMWRSGACWDGFEERALTLGLTYQQAEAGK